MFNLFKKKDREGVKELLRFLDEIKELQEKAVLQIEKLKTCAGCGGIFEVEKMQVVKKIFVSSCFGVSTGSDETINFCTHCKVPYDRVVRYGGIKFEGKYDETKRYFKEVEVDEKGNILPTKRYIKIPKDFYKPFKSTK